MRGWATGPSWKGLMCKYQNISGWWWVGQAGGCEGVTPNTPNIWMYSVGRCSTSFHTLDLKSGLWTLETSVSLLGLQTCK